MRNIFCYKRMPEQNNVRRTAARLRKTTDAMAENVQGIER